MIYHIRIPNPRRRGNSFYRDDRVFESKTLCGAECGPCDIPCAVESNPPRLARGSKAIIWTSPDPERGLMEPCKDCLARLGK